MTVIDEVQRQIMYAVQNFASKVAVPILHEINADEVDQIGTGALYDHNGRLLLITAKHVFEEFDHETLIIPSRDTTSLVGIGKYELHTPSDPEIDIAVAELKHTDTIKRLRSTWTVLDDTSTSSANGLDQCVLTAYPSEKNIRIKGLLGSSLLSLHTMMLPEVPAKASEPVTAGLDLFFHLEAEAENVDGSRSLLPYLGGCSGGPIWRFCEPTNLLFWTPEQCLKLIGIQSTVSNDKTYFRGKSWEYVKAIFEKM